MGCHTRGGDALVGLRSLLDRVVRRRAKLVPEERLQFETLLSELGYDRDTIKGWRENGVI